MIRDPARPALSRRLTPGTSGKPTRSLSLVGRSSFVLPYDLIPCEDLEFDPCA
jgi:hypothetical protein